MRNDIAVVIPVPKDKRSVFVVPWGDFTYIGTTDTDYDGPLDDPQCTPEDIDYLLEALNFVDRRDDPQGRHHRHVGRPAPAREARVERSHRRPVAAAHGAARRRAGVVTVTGGKLTTYRRMAADTVDAVVQVLGDQVDSIGSSRTKRLLIRGADGYETAAVRRRRAPRCTSPAATAARPRACSRMIDGTRRWASRSLPAPLPQGRGGVRGPPRDGPHVDDVLSRRTRARACSHATPRPTPRRRTSPGCIAPALG